MFLWIIEEKVQIFYPRRMFLQELTNFRRVYLKRARRKMAKTRELTLVNKKQLSMWNGKCILKTYFVKIFSHFMENDTSLKPLLYSYLETAFQLSSVVKKVFSVQNHVQSFRSSSLFKATVKV